MKIKISSSPETPFLDVSDFVKTWRQKRANRVGYALCLVGIYLALIATVVGFFYSNTIFWSVHFLIFLGCSASLYFSRQRMKAGNPEFLWQPAYFSYWLSSFGTFSSSGGINSPFIALVLLGLYVVGIIVQTRVRHLYVAAFIAMNVLFWAVIEFFHPFSNLASPLHPLFTASILFLGMGVLVTCMVEILRTERKMAEEILDRYSELHETNQKLEKEEVANAMKSTFLASVSHELRTPLGAIMGYADLLKDSQSSMGDKSRFVETIRRNGQQLSQLVNDLLDLSKVEAGKIEIERLEFSLHQIFVDVVELLKVSAQKKNIDLEVRYQTPIPQKIVSDPLRIRQVLTNMLGNALKFTAQGSVSLEVRFKQSFEQSPENDPAQIIVSIVDTGRGLTDDEQAKLFQPFGQAEASVAREYGGTGLGLNLSRQLAELLGGKLVLTRSELGCGSVFTFSFPVEDFSPELISHFDEREVMQANAPQNDSKNNSRHNTALQDIRILIVDDMPDNQSLIRAYLRPAGAQIDLANNGLEGFEMATKGNYDVILMDIQMPVMDGLQATQKLRAQGYTKAILAITAHAMKENREECLRAGCDDYLTKPVQRAYLIERICHQLQLKKSGQLENAMI